MTLASVQERAAEIAARLASLAPQRAFATGTAFRAELAAASAVPSSSSPSSSSFAPAVPAAGGLGERAVDLARQHLGKPYRWGATGPDAFDCSGLVRTVYRELGVELPRVSRDQARAGVAVSAAEARPGDLVFFGSPVDHVGIYAGDGTMIVAPQSGERVRVQRCVLERATAIRRVTPDVAAPGAEWTAGLPAAGRPYAAAIESAARQAGLDPRVVAAVAWSESGFDAGAVSRAGATGLMQLMPGTAASLGVDPRDPAQPLLGGARYLKAQLDRFGGRLDVALAAYNAGPGAVARHGGIPPYPETQTYVRRVLDRIGALGGSA